MQQTALILGAHGRFGRHVAQAFVQAGWATRAFDRHRDNLCSSARGAQIIVNGWNPSYPVWRTELPGLTGRLIEAARATGATIIQPGNVYVFGADAPACFSESTPHAATNPLGRARITMETALRASGLRCIVIRAGDFLDTEPSGNWFDTIIAKPLIQGKLTYPGRTDAPHAWAYLPDVARAVVMLAEIRDKLELFEDIPFPGYTLSGQEMARAVSHVLGREMRPVSMNWFALLLARPFWPMAKHLLEMRYLWDKPHHLDEGKFRRLVPGFHDTPLEAALTSALKLQIDPHKAVA